MVPNVPALSCTPGQTLPVSLALEPAGLSSLSSAHTVFLPHPTSPCLEIPNLIFRLIYLHLFTPLLPGLLSLNLHLFRSTSILAHVSWWPTLIWIRDELSRFQNKGTNGTELSLFPNLLFHEFHIPSTGPSRRSFPSLLQHQFSPLSSIPNSSQQADVHSTFNSVLVGSFLTFLLIFLYSHCIFSK